jgi:surface antigen
MKKVISYFKVPILLNFLLICLCTVLGANKDVNAVCTQDSVGGQCVAYVRGYYDGSPQEMPGLCQYDPINCGALNAWGHWDLGFRSGQIPAKDSIMVLDQWSGVPTGHMAVVTDVRNNCDGTYTLTIDESNWDLDEKVDCNVTYTFFKTDSEVTRESGTTKYSVLGFIHGSYLSIISKGLEYLRCQQQANGSWQNQVGYTAMSTLAFLNAEYTEGNDDVVSDGIQYLLSNVRADGGIYGSYGNYETALSILALKATGNSDYDDEIANAANYLKSIQSDDSDDPVPKNTKR